METINNRIDVLAILYEINNQIDEISTLQKYVDDDLNRFAGLSETESMMANDRMIIAHGMITRLCARLKDSFEELEKEIRLAA